MKNILILFIFVFIFNINAKIVNSSNIEDVLSYSTENSVVFFNVDEIPYNKTWCDYFESRVRKNIPKPLVAESFINKIKSVLMMDSQEKRVIETLQKKKIAVWGLSEKFQSTHYCHNLAEVISGNLQKIGFQFEKGILFTNKSPIGQILSEFVQKHPFNATIILVDTQLSHLESAEKALDVPFIGIHYQNKEECNYTLGTIQFLEFAKTGRILSNEEALQRFDPETDYEELLDRFILNFI